MAIPTRGSSTDETQIHVLYSALTTPSTMGGASIDSYNLQWDNNTDATIWYDLQGEDGSFSTMLEFIQIPNVLAGFKYKF